MIPPPRSLVLSPAASHPQNYGNRNRVWQVTNFLKESGYTVDFLFYPFEGEWNHTIPPEADDMRRAWDSFWIVPPGRKLHQPAHGEYHQIDEWWDETIGHFLTWLFERRSYDVFVVNYTFFSKAFTFAPKTTIRILETHDIFSGRKEMLSTLGAKPEFFYTTEEEERIAFNRADLVVAIKQSEAELIRRNTAKEVISLPFFPANRQTIRRKGRKFAGLSVGFIGAPNSVNALNVGAFLEIFDPMVRLYCPPLRLLIAGEVCRRLDSANPAFELLGKVDSVEEFYSQVDVIVAPMIHSTGIKIKVGEALGLGKGVVSTANGFDGYPATDPMHTLSSLEGVGRALIQLAFDSDRLTKLISNSRVAAETAEQSTKIAFKGLASAVRDRRRRVGFLVDEPYWSLTDFHSARLAQWADLCGYLMPVIIFFLNTSGAPAPKGGIYKDRIIEEIDASGLRYPADLELLVDKLNGELKSHGCTEVMVSVKAQWAAELCKVLTKRGHHPIADLWSLPLAEQAARAGVCPRADLWAVNEEAKGGFETMALRFVPDGIEGWPDRPIASRILLLHEAKAGEAEGVLAEVQLAAQTLRLPLDIISGEKTSQLLIRLFEFARNAPRPLLFLSVGRSPKLAQACLSMASIARLTHFDISSGIFPLALADDQGRVRMLYTRYDLIVDIVGQLERGAALFQARQTHDAGWSHLWKRLERGTGSLDPAREAVLAS